MNFTQYQKRCIDTAIYPKMDRNLIYTVLGLAGEAGELANKVKKLMRDYMLAPGESIYSVRNRISENYGNEYTKEEQKKGLKLVDGLVGELGGVLWYTAMSASELGKNFDDIATNNIDELASRKSRGKVSGSGDNR